jgi:hypothetical protein
LHSVTSEPFGLILALDRQIFGNTRFPEMNVDWRTHRDNVGHLYTLGCFRCHDDQHVSADGKRISKECTVCHTVLGENGANAEFQHPVEDVRWRAFSRKRSSSRIRTCIR